MALLFIVGVVGHAVKLGTGAKWLIFMTDLRVMFLALHYVIDAILAVCRWIWEHANPNDTCK
jgi:hypothetical protein